MAISGTAWRRRSMVAFTVVVLGCALVSAAGDAETLREAATHREAAGMAQMKAAAELMRTAADVRDRDYLYPAEQERNFKAAGDAESRAGDVLAAAVGNFERAEALRRSTDEAEAADQPSAMARAARQQAARAFAQAARDYAQAGAEHTTLAERAARNAAHWRAEMAHRP